MIDLWTIVSSVAATIVSIFVIAGAVAQMVRAPLLLKIEMLDRDIKHNRASADTHFQVRDIRLDSIDKEVIILGKNDVAHSTAIAHFDQAIKTLNTTIDRQFDEMKEAIKDLRG